MTHSIEDLLKENAELKRQIDQMQDYNLKKAVEYQKAMKLAAETVELRKLVAELKHGINAAIDMVDDIKPLEDKAQILWTQ